MRLKDKMFPLTTQTKHLIEKQLKKEKITPRKSWDKQLLGLITKTEEGDTFFTIFNMNTKEFYNSCAIYNELDDFDAYIGEIIAVNRMGLNLNFQKAVIKSPTLYFDGEAKYTTVFADGRVFHNSSTY